MALNGLKWVEVHPLALGAQAGTETLYGHGSTSMWSIIEREGVDAVAVGCTTLDELAASGTFGMPQLVKIDAEGAEIEILRGGRLLEPRAILRLGLKRVDVPPRTTTVVGAVGSSAFTNGRNTRAERADVSKCAAAEAGTPFMMATSPRLITARTSVKLALCEARSGSSAVAG